ncbi:hypothetical protein N7517_005893 [Penicillium concentricum]|uniref:Uncharacterized protein n=1 Tax=Penicillium concentricum TaxID=293559 RepID=A0A9W9V9L8_9EURO|nr:uncharacterized protein N7517_005893 [Penicillium concentricum]KAJ5373887.1 hypothetical protein N7517_005893 [Penicillium concentricum]
MCHQKPLDPALGNLGVFPPEIILNILDEFLGSSPRLTHENFHSINQLMKTNKTLAEYIKLHWMDSNASNSFKQRVNAVQWYPNIDAANAALTLQGVDPDYVMPIEGPPGLGPDLITGIILNDCTDCFEWFNKMLPATHMRCCNEGGWSFRSLALYANAGKVLDRYSDLPHKSSDFIAGSANATGAGPSVLGVSASSRNPSSFAKVLKQMQMVLSGPGFQKSHRDSLVRND